MRDPQTADSIRPPLVLVLAVHYLPGFRAGGPIRSISRLVEGLRGRFLFRVVTSDRDLGDRNPYSGLAPSRWTLVNGTPVWYSGRSIIAMLKYIRILQTFDGDVLYVNSLFSLKYSVLPMLLRWMRIIPQVPTLLAPRGELGAAALSIHRRRKVVYLSIVNMLGVYRHVVWHASSSFEASDIRAVFGATARVTTASPVCHGARARGDVPSIEVDPKAWTVLRLGLSGVGLT
jgi:hypothetical protein